MLSVEQLNDALTELGRRARAQGKVVEIAIYGGSALMLASMSRIGNPYNNAKAESFMRTLKYEQVDGTK
jgi:transposase InsO family protein